MLRELLRKTVTIRVHWKATWTLMLSIALWFLVQWVLMQRFEPVDGFVVFDRLEHRYCAFSPLYSGWACSPSLTKGPK